MEELIRDLPPAFGPAQRMFLGVLPQRNGRAAKTPVRPNLHGVIKPDPALVFRLLRKSARP